MQLQTEVTSASDTLEAFSEETLKEQKIFDHAKRAEMKDILGELVDGQIEIYEQVCLDVPACGIIELSSR
jgi:sorting nexin-4